jgi:hypothetical protein
MSSTVKPYKPFGGASRPFRRERSIEPEISAPEEPGSHPIMGGKLAEWERNALEANADNEPMRRRIRNFARDVRHVSFSEFKNALAACFRSFHEHFPTDNFIYKLANSSKYTQNERGNSEPWLRELVIHEGMYTPPVPLTQNERVLDQRRILKLFVEDATFTGDSLATKLCMCIDVYVIPYIKSIPALVNKLNECLVLINARTGEITHAPDGVPDDAPIEYKPFAIGDFDHDKHLVVLYFEEMKGKPFYFDHKLADHSSWTDTLWMFRGFHHSKPSRSRSAVNPRTNFIAGCDAADDSGMLEDHYYCPMPPYAYGGRGEGKQKKKRHGDSDDDESVDD